MRLWHGSRPSFDTTTLKRYNFGGGDKSGAEQGIQQAGQQMYERGQMTGAESSQYGSSFELGKLLEEIQKYKQGLGAMPSGYMTGEGQYQQGGPLAKSYYEQTLAGTQDPYAAYESTLAPQLQLAQDQINRSTAQRGLLRSGIPIEQMGRAGVDLAIKEAQDRMNYRSQELARGGELSQYANQLEQQNYGNLADMYNKQQGYGQTAMQRQAQQAQQAAQYQAYPYQAELGDYYGNKAGTQKGIYTTAGTVIGGTAGAILGGPAGATLGANLGASAGGSFAPNQPTSIAGTRTQPANYDPNAPWKLSASQV